MPLKIEQIDQFLGFGNEGRRGEYYFSAGMSRQKNGSEMGWWISQSKNSGNVSGLKIFNWFAERDESGAAVMYAVAEDGIIYKANEGTNDWAAADTPGTSTKGNGLIVDQKGRLLYPQVRYLGKYDGIGFDDTWKDFGFDISPDTTPRPADLYQKLVVIGNGTATTCSISVLDTSDDSFNATAFTLPDNFTVRDLKSGKGGILIGANFSERGVLILWDGLADQSIAPWIWVEGKINSIAKFGGIWIVSAGRKYLITNGYRILDTFDAPCPINALTTTLIPFGPRYPSGMIVHENRLFTTSGQGTVLASQIMRERKGVYIYDLRTRLWEFCPSFRWDHNIKALFISSAFNIYTSFEIDTGVIYVGYLNERTSNATQKALLITGTVGKGNNQKMAEGIILGLRFSVDEATINANPNISVKVKLYDFKRQLWGYGQTNDVSTDKKILKVDGSVSLFNHVEVGDEITIMEFTNAKETRHIVSIANAGTNTEEWTMDSDFTNLTENASLMNIMPFKLVGSKTLDDMKVNKNRLYIPITKSIQSKHFMIKIEFINTAGNMTPHIESVSFVYNDLGFI